MNCPYIPGRTSGNWTFPASSVHYVRWELIPAEVAWVASGPVSLVVDHSGYQHSHVLGEATVGELLSDLQG